MNRIAGVVMLAAAAGLSGCVGYGLPGSGVYSQGGNAYPGNGYGYPSGGGYNEGYAGGVVRCESNDERTRYCDIDTRRGVRLTRQLSGTRCIQGRNWGFDNRGVWVSQGCRAEFASGGGGGPGYGGNSGGQGQVIRCESNDNRQRRCNVAVRRSVDLLRQLSGTRCVRGQNWGWDRGGVWVDGGCRGEFRVN